MTSNIDIVERANKLRIIGSVILIVIMFSLYFIFHTPNRFFPHDLVIPEGATLQEVSKILKDDNLISSRSAFNIIVTLKGDAKYIKSGTYIFKEKTNLFKISERLTKGIFGQDIIEIRIKEGHTLEGVATVVGSRLKNFDEGLFYNIAKEGYLFPDTYRFLEYTTTEEFVSRLEHEHNEVVSELLEQYPTDRPLEDIIIMASIIEKEADTPESKRMVSDILWSRIENEMALQVDATFVYGIGKGTFDLTIDDLVEDGPYNTYVNKGLPPTAIANPGKDSIEAALNPTSNDYVFFLTGRDGEMYYAVTYEDHLVNKRRFLD